MAMARPKDAVIEQSLRRVARDAIAKDEELSVKQARARVEKELNLEAGFFLSTNEWKQKSKSVLLAAYTEAGQGEEPERAPAPITKLNAPTSQSLSTTSQSTAKRANGEKSSAKSKTTPAPKQPEEPKQVNGVKRKAEEESTSDEDSESGSGSGSEVDDKADARQQKKARTDASSSSAEESEDNFEEESEDDEDQSENDSRSPQHVASPTTQTVPAIPPKAFRPPTGFIPVESDLLTARLPLSPASIDGKQIWHITAPSSLSFSSIKELSLDALRAGQPVLIQNRIEYVLSERQDSDSAVCAVLLPAENAYQQIDHRVERALHLQQKISLPNLTSRQVDLNTGSSAAAEVRISPVTSSRQQPKGLRMRYKPPGSGPGRPGIAGSQSDSDEDDQTALNVSATTGLTQDVDKMNVDENVAEQPARKTKKKPKSKEAAESTEPTTNGVRGRESGLAEMSKPGESSLVSGTPEETPSKEERKRLRREKKEAKQKAK